MPGGPFIRLNRMVFDRRQRPVNAGAYNYTLLHEIGHIIDWAYDAMSGLRSTDPDGYRALMAHTHVGATQGPSENYADGYADFFFRGGRRDRSSVPHGWVLPQRMDRRLDAIIHSRAFTSI